MLLHMCCIPIHIYTNTKYIYYRRLGLLPARVRIDLSARPPVRPSSTLVGSYLLAT